MFSPVQRAVLMLVVEGLSDREIGNRLHYSEHTIDHYVQALRRRVSARNRTALAVWAVRNGFDGSTESPGRVTT